jgi:hypothetical protein
MSQTYTGAAVTPQIVITDNETALTENVDYKETKSSNPRQNGQTL